MSGTRCDHAASDLVPWYANGSLQGDEAARVREHVESCRSCAAQLDDLLALGRLIEREGVPLLSEAGSGERAAHATVRPWIAYGAAAVLAVPAALGICWSVLGFPGVDRGSPLGRPAAPTEAPQTLSRPSSGSASDMRPSALLDLGGGSPRGPAAARAFQPPAAVDSIQVVFSVPVNPEASYRIVLRGPAGEILTRDDERLPLGFDGSARYAIPARVLRDPGPYMLVVNEKAPGRPQREFAFPFEIESPPNP